MASLDKSTFEYLTRLEKNNNREWFLKNKAQYEIERQKVIEFAEHVLQDLNGHDNIANESGKKSLHRIYRDIRFSKDKTPYKNHWPISFNRAGKSLRGSYYIHLQPKQVFIGCGFWGPEKEDLHRIRQQIEMFGQELNSILNQATFKKEFGAMQGAKLKNGPKGFAKDDPFIELLKYKQFLISKSFTDEDIFAENSDQKISESFKKMRPFLNFMSEALSTNINGESLY